MATLTQEVFACMGNTADVTVIGDPSLLGVARVRLEELEKRWSRFISSSDICALNQSKGVAISVHPDTITLVRYLVDAQRLTNRFFDPTLLPSLVQLGYARSMSNASLVTQLDGSLRWGEPLVTTSIDIENSTVTLPAGLTLDPGGLGKGLAADIVASELRELGAEGVCVSIGGDIRCSGIGPINGAWSIPVASPFPLSDILATGTLFDGAIATSSLDAKTWSVGNKAMHHVLSPKTGQPLPRSLDQVIQTTVIGAEAVWAEVFATVALVAGVSEGFARIEAAGLAALAVFADGRCLESSHWKEYTE
ncbi:MAG: FAD:protein FMN transferase [Acidimicrobiia bacterium]